MLLGLSCPVTSTNTSCGKNQHKQFQTLFASPVFIIAANFDFFCVFFSLSLCTMHNSYDRTKSILSANQMQLQNSIMIKINSIQFSIGISFIQQNLSVVLFFLSIFFFTNIKNRFSTLKCQLNAL